jgi:hypothetical protein
VGQIGTFASVEPHASFTLNELTFPAAIMFVRVGPKAPVGKFLPLDDLTSKREQTGDTSPSLRRRSDIRFGLQSQVHDPVRRSEDGFAMRDRQPRDIPTQHANMFRMSRSEASSSADLAS